MANKRAFTPTAEYFKENAYRTVIVPGFNKGEELEFKLRNISLVSLMTTGKITNTLMGSAVSLFNGKNKNVDLEKMSGEQLSDLIKLMKTFCREVMVEPSYDDVGEYLTDEMIFAIFGSSTKEVADVSSFREEPSDN